MIGERRNVLLVLAGSAVLMTLCSQTQELAQELTGSRKGELTRNLAAKLIAGSEQFAAYTKNIAFHATGFQKGIKQGVWDRNRRLTARGKEVFESVSPGAGATQAALGFAGKSSSPASSQDATEVQHRMDEKAVFRAVARGDPDGPRWIVPCAARIQVRRLSGATSCHRNPNVKPNFTSFYLHLTFPRETCCGPPRLTG